METCTYMIFILLQATQDSTLKSHKRKLKKKKVYIHIKVQGRLNRRANDNQEYNKSF